MGSPGSPRSQGAPGRRRRCPGCGSVLAADNTARLCSRCHREERDQLRTPTTDLRDSFFEIRRVSCGLRQSEHRQGFPGVSQSSPASSTVRQGSQPRTTGTVARAHASPGEQARKRQARAESGSSPKLRRRPPLAAANAVVRSSRAKPPSSFHLPRVRRLTSLALSSHRPVCRRRVVRSPSLLSRGTSSKLVDVPFMTHSPADKCCESRGLGGDCTAVCRRGEGSRTVAHAR